MKQNMCHSISKSTKDICLQINTNALENISNAESFRIYSLKAPNIEYGTYIICADDKSTTITSIKQVQLMIDRLMINDPADLPAYYLKELCRILEIYRQQRLDAYTKMKYTDCVIRCQDRDLYFVKYLLAECEYFDKLFKFQEMDVSNIPSPLIINADFPAITMTYILEYLAHYTIDSTNIDDLMLVFQAADFYGITNLQTICIDAMCADPDERYLEIQNYPNYEQNYKTILNKLFIQDRIHIYNSKIINDLFDSDYVLNHPVSLRKIVKIAYINKIPIDVNLLENLDWDNHIDLIYAYKTGITDKKILNMLDNINDTVLYGQNDKDSRNGWDKLNDYYTDSN